MSLRRLTKLERAKRFELSTLTLARLCSTPELRPHPFRRGYLERVEGSRKAKNAGRRLFCKLMCGGTCIPLYFLRKSNILAMCHDPIFCEQ